MSKNAIIKLQKALITAFAILFGLMLTLSVIGFEQAGPLNTFFKAETFKTIQKDDDNVDPESLEYYKSDYTNLADLTDAAGKKTEEVMAEGAVLLKNEIMAGTTRALPLNVGSRKVSVFGITSAEPAYGGTGSGSVNTALATNWRSALTDAGLELNKALADKYASSASGDWYTTAYRRSTGNWGGRDGYKIGDVPWSAIQSSGISFASYGDAAIFIIGRVGGEGGDLQWGEEKYPNFPNRQRNDLLDGNYLKINSTEISVLQGLKAAKDAGTFGKIIVVVNSPSMLQYDFLDNPAYGIDAALWVGVVGLHGTKGAAKIITGEVNPSGKLSATGWKDHLLNPVMSNYEGIHWPQSETDLFGLPRNSSITNNNNAYVPEMTMSSYVTYQEGVYLGYKYTETRYEDYVLGTQNVGEFTYNNVVSFPFAHGKSYTSFSYSNYNVEKTSDRIYTVTVDVKNTGSVAGKDSVQVYVQKPYGTYEKNNKIEHPSVELVDFAKTKLLGQGETQKLTIEIDEKYFASYDAYGKGTYVISEGDHYVAIGSDAHDAVNNILAAKGLNATQKAKMDAAGNANLAKKFTLSFDDKKYSKSDTTGEEIKNLFDHGDLNRYSGKGANSIKYMTRQDWNGTTFKTPEIKLTKQMANEFFMQAPGEFPPGSTGFQSGTYGGYRNADTRTLYEDAFSASNPNPDPVKKDTRKYPTYSTYHDGTPILPGSNPTSYYASDTHQDKVIKLIDMRGIPATDAKWETFMNQLSWDEVVKLVANGYHATAAVESIAKPKMRDENGPNGYNYSFETPGALGLAARKELTEAQRKDPDKDSFYRTTAFPGNGILAASFNKNLAWEVGRIMGNDALWHGLSGLYGLGLNIQRSPYLGRNTEYYSECGMLTGIIGAYQAHALQYSGVNVYNKHCVVNDVEGSRHGVSVWIPEQAIREIYLRAFELPITMRKLVTPISAEPIETLGAMNTMSSFARIGTITGAADGKLANGFLRGECGMGGIIVTDMYTDMNGAQGSDPYFSFEYGIWSGGCDIPDGDGHDAKFNKFKENPNATENYGEMAWKLRETAKRICYSTANCNGMNGVSSSTQFVELTPAWQVALIAVDWTLGVLLAASVGWFVVSFILNKRKA